MVTSKRGVNGSVRVTFELPADIPVEQVAVCGDFNNWSADDLPMRRTQTGAWSATVALPSGQRYRYRYLVDRERWANDWTADDYEPNRFGGDDSVVILE